MENDDLWHIITNILAKNHHHDLHYVQSRADVRDALYSTIVQTFDVRPTKIAD